MNISNRQTVIIIMFCYVIALITIMRCTVSERFELETCSTIGRGVTGLISTTLMFLAMLFIRGLKKRLRKRRNLEPFPRAVLNCLLAFGLGIGFFSSDLIAVTLLQPLDDWFKVDHFSIFIGVATAIVLWIISTPAKRRRRY